MERIAVGTRFTKRGQWGWVSRYNQRPDMPDTGCVQELILVGLSTRVLAESAVRGGIRVIAIDLFADLDTREAAHCIAVPSLLEGHLIAAIERAFPGNSSPQLVYASGIDTDPDLVRSLSQTVDLIGNPAGVLQTINSPDRFFALLDSLSIPYPESCFHKPANPGDWVVKLAGTQGGTGVFSASHNIPVGAVCYYQKRLPGPSLSVLFLANSQDARVIGFNTQWNDRLDPLSPYRLSGIVNHAAITYEQKKQLCEYIAKLVKSASLVGLGTLDFMIEDGCCKVLEVNPRPSASMALFDERYPAGLLNEHIRAVAGCLGPEVRQDGRALGGFQIVYANQTGVIGDSLVWPVWVKDRPAPGSRISIDDPLCTVTAKGDSIVVVRELLAKRGQLIGASCFA